MKKSSPKKGPVFAAITTNETTTYLSQLNKKLPTWAVTKGLIFPSKLSLEQCSGEKAALYKNMLLSRLFPNGGDIMADLTGGLGVDFSYMAKHFKKGIYIEQQASLCEAAHNNFPKLGIDNATIIEGNGIEQLKRLPQLDLIFMDPARRDNIGRKTVLIEDCEPDVLSLLPFLWKKTSRIMLKLSPMLDLTRAIKSLQNVCEAHIVADAGECKELLLVLEPGSTHTQIFCSDNQQTINFSFQEESDAEVSYTSVIGKYLYEPNVAILKAGAFKLVSQRYFLQKLHPNSHLYTSDSYISEFPGRSFEVQKVCSFAKKEIKELCNSVDKANLTIRNFPGSVAELRKRLKLKEGGDAYWFATTLFNSKHVIIDCRKVPPKDIPSTNRK